ncbi:MAG: hypothetical protein HUU46_07465 [Candidatus Hydrogenedentes bacterium]|nr:hypothetical protein [Candidatus Hydrogenedentota bacterium]
MDVVRTFRSNEGLLLSGDGSTLLRTASDRVEIHALGNHHCEIRHTIHCNPDEYIEATALSSDGVLVVASVISMEHVGALLLSRTDSLDKPIRAEGLGGGIDSILFSPTGKRLVLNGMGPPILVELLWNDEGHECRDTFPRGINVVCIKAEGSCLAFLDNDTLVLRPPIFSLERPPREIRFVNWDGFKDPYPSIPHKSDALLFSAWKDERTGETMGLSAAFDNILRVMSVSKGELLVEMRGHEDRIVGVAALPERHAAISASMDGSVRLWDLKDGRVLHAYQGLASIRSFGLLRAVDTVVVGDVAGRIRLLEICW